VSTQIEYKPDKETKQGPVEQEEGHFLPVRPGEGTKEVIECYEWQEDRCRKEICETSISSRRRAESFQYKDKTD